MYQIEQEMPAKELRDWARYLEARPMGWQEDNRTCLLLNAQGVKRTADEIFPTIARMKKWENEKSDEETMRGSLRKSAFGALLESAQQKNKK